MWNVLYQPFKFVKKHLQAFWFVTFPPKLKTKPKVTLQDILQQLSESPSPQQYSPDHYKILDKMVMLEIYYLQQKPDLTFVGLSKVPDENEPGAYKIRFVPCIVRPETLYLGFNKN